MLATREKKMREVFMAERGIRLRALKAACPHTIPIFAGFWFLALTYGVMMNRAGFSFLYPAVMSVLIFGGSLEFVAVTLLTAPYAPLQTLIMALIIQARHLMYGISMLDVYRGTGWKKAYLIFGMCDETFSINYTALVPKGVDRGWFMFFVTLLNHAYWVTGAVTGGLLGSLISFDTRGLEFVMPAMFAVIFMEQWIKEKRHATALIGLGCAAGCLALFGKEAFMIPAMVLVLALLGAFRGLLEEKGGEA